MSRQSSRNINTLLELLYRSASRYPNRPALSMNVAYRTRTETYSSLMHKAECLAVWLAENGVDPGDAVLMIAPSSPQAVLVFVATLVRGAVFVPLNTQSTPSMVQGIAQSCGAKILFTARAKDVATPRGVAHASLDLLEEYIAPMRTEDLPEETIVPSTVAQIMYTSGTTGEPKGVVLTHENMLTTILGTTQNVPITKHDRLLSILPLSHIYEQVVGLFMPLAVGAHVVYLHRPSALVPLLKEHRITKMAGVPEFLRILMGRIEHAAEQSGRGASLARMMRISSHIPSMRVRRLLMCSVHRRLGGRLALVASGGSPLDPGLEQKWNALGIRLLQGYGLTEVAGVATMNTVSQHTEQSVGKALPGVEVRIAEDGEICLRGPSVTGGYYKRDDATAAVFDADHWFHTGDIGELDKDGFLFIRGRKKYMLKGGGGQNIYPEDIETQLDLLPHVVDSCVVGVESGEHMLIVAVVRVEDSAADCEAIQKQVNTTLASYQRVNKVLVWPEHDFPRSASRKVKRDPVREWAQGTVAGAAVDVHTGNVSRLMALIANVTGMKPGAIQPSAGLVQDLGLDSLMRVELVSRIEVEFGALVDETKITHETTVRDLEVLVEETGPTTARDPFVRWPLSWWAQFLRAYVVAPLLNGLTHVLFRTTVHGSEYLHNISGPCLVMPNHTNVLDSVAIARTLPAQIARRQSHAAGADTTLFGTHKKWLPGIRLWLNPFSLPRKDDAAVADGLAYVGWMLDRNYSVVLFPEGDTKEDDIVLPIKDGAALLAARMAVPVLPVYITNMAHVMNPHGINIVGYFKRVHVWYGRPLHFSHTESNEEVRLRLTMALNTLRQQALRHEVCAGKKAD